MNKEELEIEFAAALNHFLSASDQADSAKRAYEEADEIRERALAALKRIEFNLNLDPVEALNRLREAAKKSAEGGAA
jgi:ElaB/YqjD/DUF883 family membrane-anchored ribosome-binding protein